MSQCVKIVFLQNFGFIKNEVFDLALNPPYFSFFVFFFCFLVYAFAGKKTVLPPKRGHFCVLLFCVSLCFSLAFLSLLLFHFLFLFFVFWLSLSLSLLFFSCFLPFCFSFLHLLLAFSFCFVCFFVSRCYFVLVSFLFFCVLSCLLSIIMFDLFLLCILFSCCCCFFVLLAFLFCYVLIFGNLSKTSLKNGNCKTAKTRNAEKKEKTDILTRAISTIMFTNSVFFSFLCFFMFCIFAENTIKTGVSAPPKKKTQKNYKLTGPSIS